MGLKSVLSAQKSGKLDLIPENPLAHPSPLTIENGCAYVMFNGEEWQFEEINPSLILESLEMLGYFKEQVIIFEQEVKDAKSDRILFAGDDISDLFAEIVSKAGIYVEIQ